MCNVLLPESSSAPDRYETYCLERGNNLGGKQLDLV